MEVSVTWFVSAKFQLKNNILCRLFSGLDIVTLSRQELFLIILSTFRLHQTAGKMTCRPEKSSRHQPVNRPLVDQGSSFFFFPNREPVHRLTRLQIHMSEKFKLYNVCLVFVSGFKHGQRSSCCFTSCSTIKAKISFEAKEME